MGTKCFCLKLKLVSYIFVHVIVYGDGVCRGRRGGSV